MSKRRNGITIKYAFNVFFSRRKKKLLDHLQADHKLIMATMINLWVVWSDVQLIHISITVNFKHNKKIIFINKRIH